MDDRPGSEELNDPAAVASYVATLTAELAVLARNHGFGALGYILQMAQLEAENSVYQLNGSGPRGRQDGR
jgi:hypothetical protein